jgi:hypothetical protein
MAGVWVMRFGALTSTTVKISVSGDVTPCSLVYTYNPGNEGGACLLNVGTHLPNYTV